MTVASSRRLNAFDQWCLRRIVHIPYRAHITNKEVRRRTGQPPVTSVIAKRWHRLFGHLARADPSQDHSRILRAAINHPPADWQRRAGRPRQTWLRTIELDLRPTTFVTQRGCVHRIIQSGISLWKRLCSLMGALVNDDDELHWNIAQNLCLKQGTSWDRYYQLTIVTDWNINCLKHCVRPNNRLPCRQWSVWRHSRPPAVSASPVPSYVLSSDGAAVSMETIMVDFWPLSNYLPTISKQMNNDCHCQQQSLINSMFWWGCSGISQGSSFYLKHAEFL